MANSDSKHSREFRRMDDYVRGKLPSAEHEAFEQLLDRNPDVRRLTASHREFFDLVREGQDLDAWEALAVEQPEALAELVDHELILAAALAKGIVLSGRETGGGVSKPPSHVNPQPQEPGRVDRRPPEVDFGPERS